MKIKYLLPGLVLLAIFGLFFLRNNKPEPSTATVTVQDTSEVLGIDSKTGSMGAVEVEATPARLEPGEGAVIELVLNTHSVDLGYDYTQIASLVDDKGNSYQVLEWSGENSGHHLSGELVFGKLSENATQVQLIIDSIDNKKAVFEWEL